MQLEHYIESRQISKELAERLGDYPRSELEPLLASLQPSANALKGLLQLIDEIAVRESISAAEVFSSQNQKEILQQENTPRKERSKKYRQLLEMRRYPEVAKIRHCLDDNLRQLAAECNLRFELPKDLEGDTLSVSFNVRSSEDLLTYAKRIEVAAKHSSTESIFSILRGEY